MYPALLPAYRYISSASSASSAPARVQSLHRVVARLSLARQERPLRAVEGSELLPPGESGPPDDPGPGRGSSPMPTPPGAVLMAPWCDLSLTAASYAANHACDSVTRNMLRVGARVYSGALDPTTHPGVSPLLGDMAGLPPLLIQVGSCDALLDDSLALAPRVKAAGGTATLDVAHAMPHVYAMIAAVCPRGQQAFEDAARVLTQ